MSISYPAVTNRATAPEAPQHFYLRYWLHDGISMPDEIGGTPESLQWHGANKRERIERFRFEEIDDPKRFCLAEWRWGPATVSYTLDRTIDDFREAYRDYLRRGDEWPAPVSLLDIPGGDDEGLEWSDDDNSFFQTREDAMQRAAKLNRKSLEGALADDRNLIGIYWYVVVELGRPIPSGLANVKLCSNGMGGCYRQMNWPIRLIEPTEAERAQYPADVA